MNNLRPFFSEDIDQQLISTTVIGRVGEQLLVSVHGLTRHIRCAASCLLVPSLGDTVLVLIGKNDQSSYVLSVLVKASMNESELIFPGGASLQVQEGCLDVAASKLVLNAGTSLEMTSPHVGLNAFSGNFSIDFLRTSITSLESRVARARIFAGALTSTVARLVQKVQNSLLEVEQLLETRAGRKRTVVEGASHTHARHLSMVAESTVKIDGEKIDLA